MSRGPLVLGDLGHSLFRLSRARATSRAVGFDVKEVLYPGFEGRPPAADREDFFAQLEVQFDVYRLSHARPLVLATGFGALVLLGLRARGLAPDIPAVIQGAVPWSSAAARRGDGVHADAEAERERFRDPAFRAAFTRDHLHSPYDASELDAFFGGFATCDAYADLHRWFDAEWLARTEGALAQRPAAIDGIRVWLCGEDGVTPPEEHDAAVRALGAEWPTELAERWGHYPYLDAPGPWIGALQAAGV